MQASLAKLDINGSIVENKEKDVHMQCLFLLRPDSQFELLQLGRFQYRCVSVFTCRINEQAQLCQFYSPAHKFLIWDLQDV